MADLSVIIGLWIVAATVAVIGYVWTREREGGSLRDQASLAGELRRLADGDPVRLAAVDEFETTIYKRLFATAVIAPRLRAGVWALLGGALAATAAITLRDSDGVLLTVLFVVTLVAAVIFELAAIAFLVSAGYHAAATPRVSFEESDVDGEAELVDEAKPAARAASSAGKDSNASENSVASKDSSASENSGANKGGGATRDSAAATPA